MAKANTVAAEGFGVFDFPDSARMIDGSEIVPGQGGVAESDGRYYSISSPDLVYGGAEASDNGKILKKRVGPITIAKSDGPTPPTYGGEMEYLTLDSESGQYTNSGFDFELYSFIYETGTRVAYSVGGLRQVYVDMSQQAVTKAEKDGYVLCPVSVVGQRAPRSGEASKNPYVVKTVEGMDALTGYSAAEVFRVLGWQPHIGLSDLDSALKAAEAFQMIEPILMADSLSGPFLEESPAVLLDRRQRTTKQQSHLNEMGMYDHDFRGQYTSYRYPLRRVGSPSAGIWTRPAPDSEEEYLADGHRQLAEGRINTIDRFRGWHTDRVRAVLDGSDASTYEGCGNDTFLGEVDALTDNHALHSAVFMALQERAMKGVDVVQEVANQFGLGRLTREQRLYVAHRAALETSRYGTDSQVYGKTPQEWLKKTILPLAERATYGEIDSQRKKRLLGNFATSRQTDPVLRRWCQENNKTPGAESYYAIGLNNPAYHMRLQYEELPDDMPSHEKVRIIELQTAKAYHTRIGQLAMVA